MAFSAAEVKREERERGFFGGRGDEEVSEKSSHHGKRFADNSAAAVGPSRQETNMPTTSVGMFPLPTHESGLFVVIDEDFIGESPLGGNAQFVQTAPFADRVPRADPGQFGHDLD